MNYSLPELPYAYNALEPFIDETTMRIHHTAHHQAYVNNLNAALAKHSEFAEKSLNDLLQSLDQLPADIQGAVRNNGGGHFNHDFFWKVLAPAGSTFLSSTLEKALVDNFGSVDAFKDEFEKAALGRFGSGWAWLVKKADGSLKIESTPNQDNYLMSSSTAGDTPILGLDVWEHAYYLKYQNKRGEYAKAFWNVVNWDLVSKLGGF